MFFRKFFYIVLTTLCNTKTTFCVITHTERLTHKSTPEIQQDICLLGDFHKPMGQEDEAQLETLHKILPQYASTLGTPLHVIIENSLDQPTFFSGGPKVLTHLAQQIRTSPNIIVENAEIRCASTAATFILQSEDPWRICHSINFYSNKHACNLEQVTFGNLEDEYREYSEIIKTQIKSLGNPQKASLLAHEIAATDFLYAQFKDSCKTYGCELSDGIYTKALIWSKHHDQVTKSILLTHVVSVFSRLFELTVLCRICTLSPIQKILIITGNHHATFFSFVLRRLGAQLCSDHGSPSTSKPVKATDLAILFTDEQKESSKSCCIA